MTLYYLSVIFERKWPWMTFKGTFWSNMTVVMSDSNRGFSENYYLDFMSWAHNVGIRTCDSVANLARVT